MVLAEMLLALMFISAAEFTRVLFGYKLVFLKFVRRHQKKCRHSDLDI